MGKNKKQHQTVFQSSSLPITVQPLKQSHLRTKKSYRVEKLEQYLFQGYQATRQEDGSYVEETFGKPDVFNLVMRRVFESMNKEANELFALNKSK